MINQQVTKDKDFFGTISGVASIDSQIIDLLYVLKDETKSRAVSLLFLAIDTIYKNSDPTQSSQKINELIVIN